MDRRSFLRTAAAVGAGIALKPLPALGGSPPAASGPLASGSLWSGAVRLRGPVLIPSGTEQVFDPTASTVVEIDCGGSLPNAGLILEGALRMRPAAPGVRHTLRFVNVNEAAFSGGGDDPLSTDPGLWVRPSGLLDAQGPPRLAWTRARGSIVPGATSCELETEPTGWSVGDEVLFVPSAAGQRASEFEVRTIAAVSGSTVSFASLSYQHPAVQLPDGRVLNPEVINLSRDVAIEGTPGRRSHIHIFGAGPQTVSNVGLRYLGLPVRGDPDRGRYAMHFHHGHDGTRGSVVEGLVARNHGSHAYVPHMSHGITFRDCVSYDGAFEPFWWDRLEPDGMVVQTHDTLWEHNVAARSTGVGFLHNFGLRNTARNNVAVGIVGPRDGIGYFWPQGPPGVPKEATVWTWQDNVAHHCNQGVRVWNNTSQDTHLIERPVAYHNAFRQIFWGAYRNPYDWAGGVALGLRPVEFNAVSSTTRSEWVGFFLDAAGSAAALLVEGHSLAAGNAQLVQGFDLRGYATAAVQYDENGSQPSQIDFVRCTIGGTRDLGTSDLGFIQIHPASVVRVQDRAGNAWRKVGRGAWSRVGAFA